MKKSILVAAILCLMGVAVSVAQPRAIGARIGYGAEVSYQHSLGEKNMLSMELGLPSFAALDFNITYDWINPFNTQIPWNEKGEWNWYMGVGAGAGWTWGAPVFWAGVDGRIGIEYQFWFPLQLSLDWRPTFGPYFGKVNGTNVARFNVGSLYAGAIALGVRYKF